MDFTGKLVGISKDWQTDKFNITFTLNEPSALAELEKIKDVDVLSITAKKYSKSRSADANRLLWHCISQIAKSHTPPIDKWDVYLMMLKRYGKYTYVCVKPNAVDAVREQWRDTEVVGEMMLNGQPSVQLLCYFGSHTYDTKEFSTLLEGVISEMAEMGLQTPTSAEMKQALEQWEKAHGKETI